KPTLTLLSENIDYSTDKGIATLRGKSRATFPADQEGKSGENAMAEWDREGVAHFVGAGDQQVIQQLDLTGDVNVDHPQVTLKSQKLNLAFDPPTASSTQPQVK